MSFENHLSYSSTTAHYTPGLLVSLLPCLFVYFKTTDRSNFRNDPLKIQLIFSSNYITELIAAGFFPGNSGHSMAKERTAQLCQHIDIGYEWTKRQEYTPKAVREEVHASHANVLRCSPHWWLADVPFNSNIFLAPDLTFASAVKWDPWVTVPCPVLLLHAQLLPQFVLSVLQPHNDPPHKKPWIQSCLMYVHINSNNHHLNRP